MEKHLEDNLNMFEELLNKADKQILQGIEYSRKYRVDVIFYRNTQPEWKVDCIMWVDFNAHPCNHNFNFEDVVAIAHNGVLNIKEHLNKQLDATKDDYEPEI